MEVDAVNSTWASRTRTSPTCRSGTRASKVKVLRPPARTKVPVTLSGSAASPGRSSRPLTVTLKFSRFRNVPSNESVETAPAAVTRIEP